MPKDPERQKYLVHRARERAHDRPHELTFEEWLDVWQRSGLLNNRGAGVGRASIRRIDRTQPWSGRNVEVVIREPSPSRPRASKRQRALRPEPEPRPVKNDRSYLLSSYPDGVVFPVSEWRARALNTM